MVVEKEIDFEICSFFLAKGMYLLFLQRHPEGVAQISFRTPEEADLCVQLLNNRWFGQRKITAETWDGKTKYK